MTWGLGFHGGGGLVLCLAGRALVMRLWRGRGRWGSQRIKPWVLVGSSNEMKVLLQGSGRMWTEVRGVRIGPGGRAQLSEALAVGSPPSERLG